MHIYIYGSFLSHKKYDSVLARIETRLTDLGLNGKISRLGAMNNAKSMVENEIKRGAKTITAVGNDILVNQVINALAESEKFKLHKAAIPFGIIPIGRDNNFIAEALGIPSEEEACNVLSARRIEKLDLGLANNTYFISSASITNQGTTIEMDKDYAIEILEDGEVSVVNLATAERPMPEGAVINPKDGQLELFIRTEKSKGFLKGKESGASIFSLKKLTILNNKKYPLILDNSIKLQTPVNLSILKQKLSIIVGKIRGF